jgi:hypothetical protein
MPLEELKEKTSSNGVEGFANVKLEKKHWDLVYVEPSCDVLDIHEVVINISLFMNAL